MIGGVPGARSRSPDLTKYFPRASGEAVLIRCFSDFGKIDFQIEGTPCRSSATLTQRVRLSPRPAAKPHSSGPLQSAAWPSAAIRHSTDTQSSSTPHSVMKPSTPNCTDSSVRPSHSATSGSTSASDDRPSSSSAASSEWRSGELTAAAWRSRYTKDGLKIRKRTRDVSDRRRSVSSSTDISSRLFSVVLATRKRRDAATSGSSPAPRSAKMMSSAKWAKRASRRKARRSVRVKLPRGWLADWLRSDRYARYASSQLMRWKPLAYSSRSRCTEAFQ
ncbi:hypothetical protein EYF80_058082 [Liparis tanakae]|uniref:Uncharacterized protein n=1 Tax=Liparis tanakae TaxID=230148 RepID=A0A4Z2ESZ6_9TELE|nr:hypothetical protein EYF80_058082 [Liparis tanakae]